MRLIQGVVFQVLRSDQPPPGVNNGILSTFPYAKQELTATSYHLASYAQVHAMHSHVLPCVFTLHSTLYTQHPKRVDVLIGSGEDVILIDRHHTFTSIAFPNITQTMILYMLRALRWVS